MIKGNQLELITSWAGRVHTWLMEDTVTGQRHEFTEENFQDNVITEEFGDNGQFRRYFLKPKGEEYAIKAGDVIGGVEVLEVRKITSYHTKELLGLALILICADGKKRYVCVQYNETDTLGVGATMMNGDFTHGPSRYANLRNAKIYGKEFASFAEKAVWDALESAGTIEVPKPATVEVGAVIDGVEIISIEKSRNYISEEWDGFRIEVSCLDGKIRVVYLTRKYTGNYHKRGNCIPKMHVAACIKDGRNAGTRETDLKSSKLFGSGLAAALEEFFFTHFPREGEYVSFY